MNQPTAPAPAGRPAASRDALGLALLIGGVALAALVAFALPAVHFRGADKALHGISAWEAVPWMTKIKLGFLAAALAAAFLPRLAALRVPMIAAAAVMMFAPALGTLVAGVYQWSDVRAEIVQLAGVRTPWIDPGWGIIALVAAALMLAGAMWRAHRASAAAPSAASSPGIVLSA